MIGDEDDTDGGIEPGTSGEGAAGQDPAGGQPEAELPAEHADDAADDGESEVAEGGERPTRGETRFQRLANETKAAREEAADARREAADLRRQTWQQQTQVTEQQEQERLALMLPHEQTAYQLTKMRREFDQQRHSDRMQTQALLDKTAFDAKATIDPVYGKFKDEVETRFQEQMRQGRPVEREILLKLLLGERALSGARNPKPKQAARARVDAQRVSPGGSKGDAATARGKAGDTPGERLRDVII